MQTQSSSLSSLSNATANAKPLDKRNHLVTPLPAFSDNYIWFAENGVEAIVIDPGQADPVTSHLHARGLALSAILITHEHQDHIGGVAALHSRFPGVAIFAPPNMPLRLPYTVVEANQCLSFLGAQWSVLATPGHTASHVSYYVQGFLGAPCLFCGDTLFAAGCGRAFADYGGKLETLFASLQVIKQLPGETLVFPAHEYTMTNVRFTTGLQSKPTPTALDLFAQYAKQRQAGTPTLPSSVAQELESNPFLRTDDFDMFVRMRALRNIFS